MKNGTDEGKAKMQHAYEAEVEHAYKAALSFFFNQKHYALRLKVLGAKM